MFHVALFEPEIAGNVGNIARTCAVVGAPLHLIRPYGFRLSDAAVRRAGMDYWEAVQLTQHASFAQFEAHFARAFEAGRVFAFTTKATVGYSEVRYRPGDVLLFGPESRGLPEAVRALASPVRIPMQGGGALAQPRRQRRRGALRGVAAARVRADAATVG